MLHSIAERLLSFTVIGPCRTCSPAQILDILTLHMSSISSLICAQHLDSSTLAWPPVPHYDKKTTFLAYRLLCWVCLLHETTVP